MIAVFAPEAIPFLCLDVREDIAFNHTLHLSPRTISCYRTKSMEAAGFSPASLELGRLGISYTKNTIFANENGAF